MARRKPLLTVITSNQAANDLAEIYDYNAKHKSVTSAVRWETFLRGKIASLAIEYDEGKPVEGRPELRYLPMKRSGRWKDGHIAINRLDDARATVRVLHIFHSKQDWENKLWWQFLSSSPLPRQSTKLKNLIIK